ncbi:HDOD domain-containing protein [Nitrosomonas cryotolerans]|uniref:Metal dependent phosphohydrolase n=1 Tax=Nitrosomonas cryotolerans ATCC 49181 TaxID=1131553 RepID=A0A1N6J295_9PROT|nr:HDOD domain-containing protein [Nitrosomonas cryotolerans]SFP53495.1 HDOD domain-containing protein [Nitrosomonas cryotolerans]SIO38246.1 metal dependent phosphohydrolase [Nitrosomonas cryotolerans ATCC 49181]
MKHRPINYKNLAAQPDIISRIIQIDADSRGCFREMDNLLRSDQSAAALILRVANSPIYNRGHQIETLPLAISLLGINVIRSLATLALTRPIFTQSKNKLIQKHIWHHSLLTAIASQTICLELGSTQEGEEAFVAGLIHDIGKVLLLSHYAEKYVNALSYTLKYHCSSAEAEQKFLGVDHYQIGQQAVQEWKLPQHFNYYTGIDLNLLSRIQIKNIVQLSLVVANSLIKGAGIGASPWDCNTRKNKLMALGLSSEFSDYLLEDVFMQGLKKHELYLHCTQYGNH